MYILVQAVSRDLWIAINFCKKKKESYLVHEHIGIGILRTHEWSFSEANANSSEIDANIKRHFYTFILLNFNTIMSFTTK